MFNSLFKEGTLQQGIIQFLRYQIPVPSFRQNLEARVSGPPVVDGVNIWQTNLNSRTTMLEGDNYHGYNTIEIDGYRAFKVDHDFDLSLITGTMFADGGLEISAPQYHSSQGTEFVIIKKEDLQGADCDYAIRRDKYNAFRSANATRNYELEPFVKVGGFKINRDLTIEEAKSSDGWLELCVGKNKASEADYAEAKCFLGNYADKAIANNCFSDDLGMSFCVNTDAMDSAMHLWYVHSSRVGSSANGRGSLCSFVRLLCVR